MRVLFAQNGTASEPPPRAAEGETPTLLVSVEPNAATPQAVHLLGSRSCSAVACHGNIDRLTRDGTTRGAEFIYWLDNDPHARAYQTLSGPRSRRMMAKLGIEATVRDAGYRNCLMCHNDTAESTHSTDLPDRIDGVGCESCHGPASQYVATHYQRDWSRDTPGFVDTSKIDRAARRCVLCHIGTSDRQVNHDMIAAGHPALRFELAGYYDHWPKHWDDQAKAGQDPTLEARRWQTGQLIAVDAAWSLLHGRASGTVTAPVWPEFAELDCFGCHHGLTQPSWRQHDTSRPLGFAYWGTWYYEPAKLLIAEEDKQRILKVREIMQSTYLPRRDDVLRAMGGKPLVQAVPASSGGKGSRLRWRELVDLIAQEEPLATPSNWERATQWYLAVSALTEAIPNDSPRYDAIRAKLQELRSALTLPPEYDSPRQLNKPRPGSTDGSLPSQRPDSELSIDDIWALIDETRTLLQQAASAP